MHRRIDEEESGAIETRGLPLLEEFSLRKSFCNQVTLFSISAIAHAVVKGCPDLTHIALMCSQPGDDYHDMVLGMLEAAGRRGKVVVM